MIIIIFLSLLHYCCRGFGTHLCWMRRKILLVALFGKVRSSFEPWARSAMKLYSRSYGLDGALGQARWARCSSMQGNRVSSLIWSVRYQWVSSLRVLRVFWLSSEALLSLMPFWEESQNSEEACQWGKWPLQGLVRVQGSVIECNVLVNVSLMH